MQEKIILIDTNSIIHRAYHALPPLTGKDGEPTNAVYGSLLVFFRALSEFNPRYIVSAFDLPGKTFRHEMYKEYKATRPKAPDDLYLQIEKTKEVFRSLGVCVLEKKGYEADDVIGTVSLLVPENIQVIIISGDLDLLQLVQKNTSVYLLRKGVKEAFLYKEEDVKEKYEGVAPEMMVEMKALKGDASDNIPGVRGVGEKTAVRLVREFGRLEEIYSSLDDLPEKLQEKLVMYKKDAFMSRDLSTIKRDVPLDFKIKKAEFFYNIKKITPLLQELNFQSLLDRLPQKRETGKLW